MERCGFKQGETSREIAAPAERETQRGVHWTERWALERLPGLAALFQNAQRHRIVALEQIDHPEAVKLGSDAVCVTRRLGDLQGLPGTGQCVVESPDSAEREPQCGAREGRGEACLAESLADQFCGNQRDRILGVSRGFLMVAKCEMREREIVHCPDLQPQISERFADDPGPTTQPQGLVELRGQSRVQRRVHQHLPHADLIAQNLGTPEGLRQVQSLASEVSEYLQRSAKLDANIDRLLEGPAALR